MTMHWVTCSIDFSNAFVQAKLNEPVWTHLPRGFLAPGRTKTCLRLKKSLYGLSIAPKMWWTYVSKAIHELGLTSSEHDPCLFFKRDLLVVLYVDDAGIAAPNEGLIDEFVEGLKKKGFDLTREGSFSEFLGIKFEEDTKARTITLTQQGLIKKIIAATGLEDCNPNWTPAAPTALGKDPEGPPMHEDWSYPSIVGMLLYLSANEYETGHVFHRQSSRTFQSRPKAITRPSCEDDCALFVSNLGQGHDCQANWRSPD
jgi:hypothetical protein